MSLVKPQPNDSTIAFDGYPSSIFDLENQRYQEEHSHDGINSPKLTPTNLAGYLTIDGDGSLLTGLTKSQVGLGNVDNTSDSTKNSASVTLTNKTLTKPNINGSVSGVSTYTPASGGTATLDLANANVHNITMPAGNITIALSNVTPGQIFMINTTQDSGGSRTVTWFGTLKWAGGVAPTLTTAGNKRDCFGFICTGSGTYDAFIIGLSI